MPKSFDSSSAFLLRNDSISSAVVVMSATIPFVALPTIPPMIPPTIVPTGPAIAVPIAAPVNADPATVTPFTLASDFSSSLINLSSSVISDARYFLFASSLPSLASAYPE